MAADVAEIVELLTTGFRNRSREHWNRAMQRLTEHPTPPGYPKYGYLLSCRGKAVGVILLIFSSVPDGQATTVRCSVSSWYVDPEFRSYATLLTARALRHKEVTYINTSPAPHTLPILTAQGYTEYCRGRYAAAPALRRGPPGTRIAMATRDLKPGDDLTWSEIELLRNHQSYGCISLICTWEQWRYPFVFMRRRKLRIIPFAYLVYCRDSGDFVRFAGPVGRFLARCGLPLVVVDAHATVPTLIGSFSDAVPKYYKGPHPPKLGDTAYSEQVIFGI